MRWNCWKTFQLNLFSFSSLSCYDWNHSKAIISTNWMRLIADYLAFENLWHCSKVEWIGKWGRKTEIKWRFYYNLIKWRRLNLMTVKWEWDLGDEILNQRRASWLSWFKKYFKFFYHSKWHIWPKTDPRPIFKKLATSLGPKSVCLVFI